MSDSDQVAHRRKLFEAVVQFTNFSGICWWFIDYLNEPDVFYCNDEMVRVFQLPPSEHNRYQIAQICPIAGDYNRHIAAEDQRIADEIFQEYQEMLEGKSDRYENEFPYLNPNGEKQYFKSQAQVVLRDALGKPLLAHGVILDVSKERALAASLQVERRKFKHLSEYDELTSLINRRKMYDILEKLYQKSASEGLPFSVMMFDVDFFKNVNDSAGHAYGDEVLKRVAVVLDETFGPACCNGVREACHSVVSRWGGEEFLVVVVGATAEDLRQQYQMIQQRLRAQDWKPGVNPMVDWITISSGAVFVSSERLKEHSIDDWIAKADDQLYVAKRRGRNQMVMEIN